MHPLVVFLMISTVFYKGGSLISFPFLTVFLSQEFGASLFHTGLIVGISPLSMMLMGFYGGYLSDKFDRLKILSVSALICGLSFFGFLIAKELWQFAVIQIFLGAASGTFHSSVKALLADLTTQEQRKTAFYLHYFAINVGASVGPLLGAWLLLTHARLGFLVTGALFIFVLVALQIFLFFKPVRFEKHFDTKGASEVPTFAACVRVLKRDRAFLYYLCGMTLLGVSYCQIDTGLALYLKSGMGNEGVKLLARLLAVNALIVIFGLYPMTLIAKKIGPLKSIFVGQFLMSVFFAAMAFVNFSPMGLTVCMIALTLGEIMAFSNGSVMIDALAVPQIKGTYFGAANFSAFAFTIGPALSGWLIEAIGPKPAFVILGAISASGILFYKAVQTQKQMYLEPTGSNATALAAAKSV